MKNRERLGLIFIIIGVIILFSLIYLVFFNNASQDVTVVTPGQSDAPQFPASSDTNATTTDTRPRNYTQYDISKEPVHEFNANDLAKMAMAFSERFGSFSSQSDYGNFTDLKLFMTDSLQEWVDSYVDKLRREDKSTGYYGIMTRAIATDVKSFDDKAGEAQVIVTTERSESAESINGGVPYAQKLDLRFVKVNGDWLVDEVYWDKQ